MSGWSCPHHEPEADRCRRLDAACILGRKGCVLPRRFRHAVPPDERVAAERAGQALPGAGPAEREPA